MPYNRLSCHKAQDSLLTSSSGYTNYRGVLNLCIILLVLSNARVALENVIKYGILVDFFSSVRILADPTILPSIQILASLLVFIGVSYTIERIIIHPSSFLRSIFPQNVVETIGVTLEVINTSSLVIAPAYVVYTRDCHAVFSSLSLAFTSVVFLKLISYHMTNYWYRNPTCVTSKSNVATSSATASPVHRSSADKENNNVKSVPVSSDNDTLDKRSNRLDSNNSVSNNDANNVTRRKVAKDTVNDKNESSPSEQSTTKAQTTATTAATSQGDSMDDDEDKLLTPEDEKVVVYPDNVNVKDIAYFMAVPTLCYQANFPQTARIRKRFIIKRGIECLFLSQLMLGLVQQWLIPTIANSIEPLKQMDYAKMAERLLKLAIPNHIIWLIGFYWFFHSCFNFWAEIMRFADREFYRDWWNSCSVQYFWANWNIPVHKWCLRHLYIPLLTLGCSKSQASVMVFLVSAFFHEYLVSVPLKMFRIWAFSGMLFQIPFAYFVATFSAHPQWANTAVWLSLILGQPLCILMYYHDYYIANFVN